MIRVRLLLLFCLALFISYGQPPSVGCNQSTTAINTIFYPNTTTNITSTVTNVRGMFLCGPNTLVYDTSNVIADPNSCRQVFVSPSSTIITNATSCVFTLVYFVKNNGTLVLTPSTNPQGVSVFYELGANIIDNSTGVLTYSCSSLQFPPVNCSSTSLNKTARRDISLIISPNPTSNYFSINLNPSPANVKIYDGYGRMVYEKEQYVSETPVDISFLQASIYYIKVFSQGMTTMQKIVKY